MSLYTITDIEPGMVLGKSIYELNNKLILAAGNKITPFILERFVERGYNYIYVKEEEIEEGIKRLANLIEEAL